MTTKPEVSDWALYKRLLSYVAYHKSLFAIAVVGFIIYASSSALLAHMMVLIERAYEAPTDAARLSLALMMLGVAAYRGIGSYLGDYYLSRMGRNIVHQLRTALFSHLVDLPKTYYDQNSRGHIISKMTFDVEQIYGSITSALTSVIREGLTVVFLLGYMFWMNWKLTLLFFAAAPFIAMVVGRANQYFKKYGRRVQSSVGDVTQVAGEAVNSYEEVKVFSGHDYERARFDHASDRNRVQSIKYHRVKSISVPVMQFVVSIAIAILLWLALSPTIRGEMAFGEFMAFMTAATTMLKPMRTLASVNALIQKGVVGAESIYKVLDEEVERDTGSISIQRAKGEVSIQKLSFKYPSSDETVLNNISVDIQPGQSIALVGKSGSGKSTIISLLSRFYDYDQGSILLDGQELKEYKLKDLRNQIALVSQSVTLFNDSIFNNIAYGSLKERSKEEVIAAAKAAHAMEFIEQLPDGMNTLIGDDGVMLSGGQRQRLAIARAILKDAPILILDEATSALDTESERYIQEAMEQVMKGRTTFVVAHRLSTIEHSDRILVINQGEIVESGSHKELLELGGYYKTLHGMQFSE